MISPLKMKAATVLFGFSEQISFLRADSRVKGRTQISQMTGTVSGHFGGSSYRIKFCNSVHVKFYYQYGSCSQTI